MIFMGHLSTFRSGRTRSWRAAAAALCLWVAPARSETAAPRDWFVHAYVAQVTNDTFIDSLRLKTDFDASRLVAVGLGRKFSAPYEHTQLEWELNAAQHWGLQNHPEINAVGIVRWHGYSWDHAVRTTFAYGLGASWAFATPEVEELEGKGVRGLVYMLFEITAAPPQTRSWSGFLRIHHRSGVFGLVSDGEGSNFIGLGLRHHF
jgi:hypothetical protein